MMKMVGSLLALVIAIPAFAIPCKQAMDAEIVKYIGKKSKFQYETTKITDVPGEGIVEVTSLVMTWNPDSDTRSTYYHLVSASCRGAEGTFAKGDTDISRLVLYDDMPGEGGVTLKVVTKARM